MGYGLFEYERGGIAMPSAPTLPLTIPLTPTAPTHAAPAGLTPLCAAAYRCCMATGMVESTCDLYASNVPLTCQAGLDQFVPVLRMHGADTSTCEVEGAPSPSSASAGDPCDRARACCRAFAEATHSTVNCVLVVGGDSRDPETCRRGLAMAQQLASGRDIPECR